jgi:hypothetical protein
MDWTKVKTKHFFGNGMTITQKGYLVTLLAMTAHFERLPTDWELRHALGRRYESVLQTISKLSANSWQTICKCVISDAENLHKKRQRDRDYHKTYDNSRQRVSEKISPPREEKIIPPISPKGFEDFWKAYPKKKAKAFAEKAYKKISKEDGILEKILSAIEKQKSSEQWRRDNGQFIPYPASWLNARRWEDGGDNITLTASFTRKPSSTCTACNATGKLPDGRKCWCY